MIVESLADGPRLISQFVLKQQLHLDILAVCEPYYWGYNVGLDIWGVKNMWVIEN